MIDIHCHILPGIDDGPSRMEESIEMARVASRDGIRTIVATPHLKDTIYRPEEVEGRVDALNASLRELDVPVQVLRGADVNAVLSPSFMRQHTINGTDYVLVEFPHSFLPRRVRAVIFRLVVEGFRPIVTHPERNGSILKDPELVSNVLESGSLVQITADSITGEFGPEVRDCSLYLLEKGMVSFIASDAHSARGRRPVLSEGLKVAEGILGRERAARLVTRNPEAVIAGKHVDA